MKLKETGGEILDTGKGIGLLIKDIAFASAGDVASNILERTAKQRQQVIYALEAGYDFVTRQDAKAAKRGEAFAPSPEFVEAMKKEMPDGYECGGVGEIMRDEMTSPENNYSSFVQILIHEITGYRHVDNEKLEDYLNNPKNKQRFLGLSEDKDRFALSIQEEILRLPHVIDRSVLPLSHAEMYEVFDLAWPILNGIKT